MLSAEVLAAVKVAVEICNNSELKREILCAPGSDYDVNKKEWRYRKQQWNEILENKGMIILKNIGLPERLQKEVMGVVIPIGMRMLTWVEYHEGTLGFSREYSIHFLNSSFFTQQGVIDNKKAAEELMKDESLNIEQKYKLACLYCFTDRIPALYEQITTEDKKKFYNSVTPSCIKQQGLVKFWSYYLMGEVDILKGDKDIDLYRFEKAIENGNKTAVEYCLERTNFRKNDAIVDASVKAVKNIIRQQSDWIVFRDQRYNDSKDWWIPNDYYVDILCLLLSKMEESQQIKFLKKDIKGAKYERNPYEDHKYSRVLRCFLDWPYQDCFMKTAGLMWEFLPEKDYTLLLLEICDKIEPKKENSSKFGEERSYDYRGLLKEFWCQSPERYKTYVSCNRNLVYDGYFISSLSGILNKLLTLQHFTCEDGKNIKLISACLTSEVKERIFSFREWREMCTVLMREEKWEILDRFVLNFFSSDMQANAFKSELSFTEEAKSVCIQFVETDNWHAVESFINWVSLPEEEIKELKKEIIYSEEGEEVCAYLILYDKKVETVDKFIRWCFPSEDEVKAFKRELVFSNEGIYSCANLVKENQLELVSEFINFGVSSEEEIKEFKKKVVHRMGRPVWESLISGYVDDVKDQDDDEKEEGDYYTVRGRRTKFEGGKWEEVEKILTWCFSSEDEINDFKKNTLLKMSGTEIHFNLVKCNRWEEAEKFFGWLGLSDEEIKKLKKDTFFYHRGAVEMFKKLLHSKDGKFPDYGSKQEAIELFLRWHLTDIETVIEFRDKFKLGYQTKTEKNEAVVKYFDLMIEQRLRDLDTERSGVKRKFETVSPNKRFCILKLKNREEEYDK